MILLLFFFSPLCKTKLSEFKLQILTRSDMTVKLNTNQLSCFLLYVSFFTPYRYKLALVCDQSTIFGKSLQLLVNSSAIMLSVLQLCSWNDFSICKTFGSKLSADGSQPPDSSPTFTDGLTWPEISRSLSCMSHDGHQNLLNWMDPGSGSVPAIGPPTLLPLSPTAASFKWIIRSIFMCSVCTASTLFLQIIPHHFKIILCTLQNIAYRLFSQKKNEPQHSERLIGVQQSNQLILQMKGSSYATR